MPSPKGMLTTGEVARALGVSINTIKSWVTRGQLEAVRLPSGHHRVPRRELERLLGGMPTRGQLRDRASSRAGSWRRYESWRRGQPGPDLPLAEVLAWVGAMLDVARAQGPIPEQSPEKKADRVRRLHRALGAIRR